MKRSLFLLLFLGFVHSLSGEPASAQQPAAPAPASPRILGDVTAVNRDQRVLTIKTQSGEFKVASDDKVVCKRVAPDAKTLDGAEDIAFFDIRVGDRVWARGTSPVGTSADLFQAKQLVLMSATSIAERNKREREAWQRRGLRGEVVAVDSTKNEFSIRTRNNETVTLALTDKADLRRYPPGSVDFTAAKPIPAADIKVGDTVMARGERSADNLRFTADTVVTGDVPRPTFGQIVTVNAEKREITVKARQEETIIHLTAETLLRRMPDDLGQNGQSAQAGPSQGGQRPQRGLFNAEAMMERLKQAPEIKLADLKPGEFVIANGPKSADGKTVTALFVLRVPQPSFGPGQQGPSIGPDGGFGDPSNPQ